MNVKILNVFHTHFDCIVNHPYYLPIQSGKALSHEDLDMQGDDEGENISERADMGEYRCVYWAWKNLPKDVDIVGLSHYRRFFDFSSKFAGYPEFKRHPVECFNQINFDIPKEILDYIKKGSVVVTKKQYFETSALFQVCFGHNTEYLQIFRDTLIELGQRDFCNYFFSHLTNENFIHPCCMFLMNRRDFNEYCAWLFPIFDVYVKNIKKNNLNNALKDRSSVFIIERVWSCYIHYKKFKLKELPFIQLYNIPKGSSYFDSSLVLRIKAILRRQQMRISWSIYKLIRPGTSSGYNLSIYTLKPLTLQI